MSILRGLRRHLGWKLFLSYLIIIVVGVLVLASAAELAIPASFDRHMTAMGPMREGMRGGVEASQEQDAELFSSFRAGVNQALFLAASAATLAAVLVSFLVSRRGVEPVRRLMAARQP